MKKYYELIRIFPNGSKETLHLFKNFKDADEVAKVMLKVEKKGIYHIRVYQAEKSFDRKNLVAEHVYYNMRYDDWDNGRR